MSTLAQRLKDLSKAGWLYEKKDNQAVQCVACAHRCIIKPGRRGVCQMRYNESGELFVPWGYVAAANVDPIEKKPLMHFLPGSDALTFGMLGCNFHCDFCQNWISSQALRDPSSETSGSYIQEISAEELVNHAIQSGSEIIASSYNEPLITSEWAIEIFKLAKENHLLTAYVSNGYATPEVLHALEPVLDAFKVDLKCFTDKKYRSLGGALEDVKNSIQLGFELGMWVEVVTLVIPGFNDSPTELRDMANFLVGISPDIPWHVTAFHPMYKRDGERTSAEILQRAAEIGHEAGLHYIYAGNLPGRVGSLEDTRCPDCGHALVKRAGYLVRENRVKPDGTCPDCGAAIAGIWQK